MSTLTGDQDVAPDVDEAGTAPGDRRFRPDVEGLRAVAVVLVVLYHANLGGLSGGFVGVDVFFVISGFVITGLLLREQSSTGRTSLLAFYGRRVRRILPAATLVIVATVIATYVVLGALFGNPTAVSARWTAVFLANIHFASVGTNYLTATLPPSPLQNFWSLAVEEQFYLVFPAIVLLAAKVRSTTSLRARLVFLLVLIISGSLTWSIIQSATNQNAAFFSPFTRAWELGLGALVAVATPKLLGLHRTVGATMTWIGVAMIAFSAVVYSAKTTYPGAAVMVPVVGTALVIAGGTAVPRWGAESVLRLGPFQWFGRLSYSLYLWHWPILIIATEHANTLAQPFHKNVVWLLVSLVAAYATFRLLENPVRHARVWQRRRWLPIGVGALLIATSLGVATIGLATHPVPDGQRLFSVAPVAPLTPAALQRQVAAAVHITSVPANLTPSILGVRADWGGPFPPCWPTYAESTVGTCEFGDPHGTKTMVLYGDSHAAMWFRSFDSMAYLFKWRFVILAKGDCPAVDLPFVNPEGYGTPGGVFTACSQWHRNAERRIAALRPDVLVMTQDADFGPNGRYEPDVWRDALARTIKEMAVPAAHIVVLGSIPQTAQGGPQCLAFNPHDVQRCSGPVEPYTLTHNAAERQATVMTGAKYIDTIPWFCSTTCTDVVGHYQIYWDPYHVTATYATVVGPSLARALVEALQPTSG